MRKLSVLETLDSIKDFVYSCKKDAGLAGFNVIASKYAGISYILGKVETNLMPKYHLRIDLDCLDPLENALIRNALKESMQGESLTPEQMDNCMVCKSEELN